MLPTGKVLYFTGPTIARAYLLDPVTRTTERVDPPSLPGQSDPANIFCAGQSLLPDGRVLIVGGTVERRVGLNTIFTFNPFTKTWARGPNMRHGRWYPSQVLLGDERTAILDGLDERGEPFTNPDLEVYDATSGTVSLAAVRGTAGQPPTGGLYPHLFSMPSGRVLVAGPERRDSWFFELGQGGALSWQEAPDLIARHTWGTGVIMPAGTEGSSTVALIGGADKDALPDSGTSTPLTSTETFDEQNAAAGWVPGPALNVGRAHHNTVLLPDGTMATVGGGYGILNGNRRTGNAAHHQIELFDPVTTSWKLGPAQAELRTYHSTALLLPDGSVLSAGDDVNGGTDVDTAEIYEPPYLFRGSRPAIDSAPGAVGYGATFTVGTRDPVARAVLIAPGAVTHANDMGQRYVPVKLSHRTDGGGVDVVAPSGPDVAPPGYYMLFLVNDAGVPSVSRFVRLRPGPKPPAIEAAPTAPLSLEELTLTATPGEGAGLISSLEWDLDADGAFDDGASNPVMKSFAAPGQHTVRVRVVYDTGLSATAERVVAIGNRAPTATIDFSPTAPLSLDAVSFTVSATDPDGSVATRHWDLDGDGSFDDGDGAVVSRAFPRKGTYTVKAQVTDDFGAGATASTAVAVANRPPIASFGQSPADAIPAEVVTFTSTASDLDGTVTALEWDTDDDGSFDDGTAATAARAYAEAGEYVVRLRATDDDAGVSVASQPVVVRRPSLVPPPPPDFTAPPQTTLTRPPPAQTGSAPPLAPALLAKQRATGAAKRALKRRFGRAYKRAKRKQISCKRRSLTRFRCRYSFGSKTTKRKGIVEVLLVGSRVTTRFRPWDAACPRGGSGAAGPARGEARLRPPRAADAPRRCPAGRIRAGRTRGTCRYPAGTKAARACSTARRASHPCRWSFTRPIACMNA